MALLSAADIAEFRALEESALPDTALHERPTRSDDSSDGETTTLSTITAALPCRVEPGGTQPLEPVIAARLGSRIPAEITVAAGTDVQPQDLLTISGQVYEVIGARPGGAWETAKVVICAEVA